MIGLRAVEARGEVASSPSSRTVPLVDTRQVPNPSAGPPREGFGTCLVSTNGTVLNDGEDAGLGALACHVDWHVDRTVWQPTVEREDLGKTTVDIGNVAAQQRLHLRDMRTHAREAQGLLAHPRAAREAGAEPNQQASRRDLLECRDGRSLSHRVAIARDQNGWAKFDAVRLFGDAGESDPYVVAEGGNLGTPDRAKAELFGKKRVLDGS